MKIISWNVNGLGNPVKRRKIKEVIVKVDPDIVLLQESKLEKVDGFLIRSIWNSRFKEWDFIPSSGSSGGLVIGWDTRIASKVDDLKGCYSLSVLLNIKGKSCWWVTNVYGPTNPRSRSLLWEELSFVHGLCSPHWCVGGDFNAIRYPTEKLGGSRITASMRSFDGFIRDCELKDIPLSNAQFTWSVNRGRVMSSRIDRFLVTSLWEDQFPDLIQETLVRPVSDHFPLLLESSRVKWGPTPFRFENMWLQHHSFLDQVKTWWEECPVTGWEGFKFMKKLKYIKEKIRTWNKEVFGDIRVKKKGDFT